MKARLTVLVSGTSMGVPTLGCDCAVCRSSDPHDRRTRPSIMLEYAGKVVIIDTDTSVARAVTTNGDGTYTAPFLQSGHYEVTVEAPNFAKADHKNLSLTVGQILAVDSSLPAASVSSAASDICGSGGFSLKPR